MGPHRSKRRTPDNSDDGESESQSNQDDEELDEDLQLALALSLSEAEHKREWEREVGGNGNFVADFTANESRQIADELGPRQTVSVSVSATSSANVSAAASSIVSESASGRGEGSARHPDQDNEDANESRSDTDDHDEELSNLEGNTSDEYNENEELENDDTDDNEESDDEDEIDDDDFEDEESNDDDGDWEEDRKKPSKGKGRRVKALPSKTSSLLAVPNQKVASRKDLSQRDPTRKGSSKKSPTGTEQSRLSPKSPSSEAVGENGDWGDILQDLKMDYAAKELERLRGEIGANTPILLPDEKSDKADVSHDNAADQMRDETVIKVPPLDFEKTWKKSKLTDFQIHCLYRARMRFFAKIRQLSQRFCQQHNRPHLKDIPTDAPAHKHTHKLLGHDVAAAVSLLNMPINDADLQSLIEHGARGFKRVTVGDTDKESILNESRRRQAASFEERFGALLPLASWPEDKRGDISKPKKLRKKGGLKDGENHDPKGGGSGEADDAAEETNVRLHPAFLPQGRYPPIFDSSISWESWCAIFDHARLRVEANGTVW